VQYRQTEYRLDAYRIAEGKARCLDLKTSSPTKSMLSPNGLLGHMTKNVILRSSIGLEEIYKKIAAAFY
jgi:hypothetical protein